MVKSWLRMSKKMEAGTLLMLLMSNILLWESVASVPRHASGAGHGEMSLHGLLDHAIILAHNVTELIAEMNSVFLEDVLYKPGRWFPERDLTACHRSPFTIAVSKEGTQQRLGVFLVKEMIGMLETWTFSLYHIANEMSHMEEPPDEIISRAKNIEEKIKELMDVLKGILNKIQPGSPENERFPVWNELAYLRSPDEERRHFAFTNLFQCLLQDSRKFDSNVRLLKCRLIYNRDC
ncbi:prolactin-6A1 isoform X1 [Rattus rattus]|uniref:prolactin-6A1 isoform X1 n=1 Tax=Rattus rattus TaxID=10117 RepID=UPI0013F30136|nr:prolactin-6A1 isoform X1 [Rattus rattus]